MNLSKVLRSYRMHEEISLMELATAIGVSNSTLSRIENNNYLPDLITFKKILDWLLKKDN